MIVQLQEWVNQQVEEVVQTHQKDCREQRKKVIPVCIVVGILIPILFGLARKGPTQRVFFIFGIIGIILALCMTVVVFIGSASTKGIKKFQQRYIQQVEKNLTESEQQLFSDELQSSSFEVIPLKCGKNKLLKPKLLFGDPFCVYCDEYGGCSFIQFAHLNFVEFEGNLFSHKENESADTVVIRFHLKQEINEEDWEDFYISMREAEWAYQTIRKIFPELTIKITPVQS